jgi:predicted transposase YbfD/YdcC
MAKTEGQLARATKKVRVTWNEAVADPRDRRGRRHSHHGLLNLIVTGFAAGQTVLRRMEELSGDLSSVARRVLSVAKRVSDTTLYMLLGSQTVAGLRETLVQQVKEMLEAKRVQRDLFRFGVLAFDGKSVWASSRRFVEDTKLSVSGKVATCSLLAEKAVLVSSAARPILDFEMAKKKSGESPAFRDMFRRVVQNFGKSFDIVTADAGLTCRQNASLVRGSNKHYAFGLKGNQPRLLKVAQALDAAPLAVSASERRGGATVTRSLYVLTLDDVSTVDMCDARQLWRVVQHAKHDSGKTIVETRHFITSLPPAALKPTEKLGLVRLHWGIENGSHWTANVFLDEDTRHPCQLSRRAIEVVTWLRALAYNLVAVRRAARGPKAMPPWRRVVTLLRDVLVVPHREAILAFEA